MSKESDKDLCIHCGHTRCCHPCPPCLCDNKGKEICRHFTKPKKAKAKEPEQVCLADQSSLNNDIANRLQPEPPKKEEDKSTEEKPKEEEKSKLKKWPGRSTMIYANEALEHLKKIIDQGYKLTRNKKMDFDYEGFNLGKVEQKFLPPLNHQFTEKLLTFEREKKNLTLMDIVLRTAFALGIEQGRRANRTELHPIKELISAMEQYRRDNRRLRLEADKQTVSAELLKEQPELSEKDFSRILKDRVAELKPQRFELARKELGADPIKAFLKTRQHKRANLKELEAMAKSFTKENCTEEHWKEILKQKGWSFEDWNKACKKKNISTIFNV